MSFLKNKSYLRRSLRNLALAFLMLVGAASLGDEEAGLCNCDADGVKAQPLGKMSAQIKCQTDCQAYWEQNPQTKPPPGTAFQCVDWTERLKQLAPKSCLHGALDGLSFLQQLKTYALLAKDIGASLREHIHANAEWLSGLNKDHDARLGLVRMLQNYSATKPDGTFVIPDSDIPKGVVDGDVVELVGRLSQEQAAREQACGRKLATLTKTWENSGLDGNALAMKRYQSLAANAPECVGALGLKPPADAKGAPDFAANGIKPECYAPGVAEKLICLQLAKLVSDPLLVVPAVGSGVGKLGEGLASVVRERLVETAALGVAEKSEIVWADGAIAAGAAEVEPESLVHRLVAGTEEPTGAPLSPEIKAAQSRIAQIRKLFPELAKFSPDDEADLIAAIDSVQGQKVPPEKIRLKMQEAESQCPVF